jgi:ketosteroid isomerase-like protein
MSIEELERRVKALEDLEEIKKLQRRYMSLLDNLEFRQAVELFAENATAEVRNSGIRRGKKEIADIYLNILAQRKERHDGHLVGQPIITVEGDTAKGTWIVYMLFSKPSVQWVQGRHDCEYVKEDGQWKFSKLKFTRTLASQPSEYP